MIVTTLVLTRSLERASDPLRPHGTRRPRSASGPSAPPPASLPMSHRTPPDDSRRSDQAPQDRADALRALLHRAVWRALQSVPPNLPDASHSATRMRAWRNEYDATIEDAAQGAIRAACTEARERDVPVARPLVQLKEAWARVPHAERAARQNGDEILARVVTLCINEFYATDGQPCTQPDSDA